MHRLLYPYETHWNQKAQTAYMGKAHRSARSRVYRYWFESTTVNLSSAELRRALADLSMIYCARRQHIYSIQDRSVCRPTFCNSYSHRRYRCRHTPRGTRCGLQKRNTNGTLPLVTGAAHLVVRWLPMYSSMRRRKVVSTKPNGHREDEINACISTPCRIFHTSTNQVRNRPRCIARERLLLRCWNETKNSDHHASACCTIRKVPKRFRPRPRGH